MAKFKVNQQVKRNSDGVIGTVKAKEIERNSNTTVVKYLVDFGGGIENWQVVTRKDISSIINQFANNKEVRFYKIDDSKVLTMVANVKNENVYDEDYLGFYKTKLKILTIGYSIYNGIDEFDETIGIKIAQHRCKKNPFTRMVSTFSGEFPKDTVVAIMDAKAKYITDNIDRFYRPQE